MEVLSYEQYRIRMFHSGRVILCNKVFIRHYKPIIPGMAVSIERAIPPANASESVQIQN